MQQEKNEKWYTFMIPKYRIKELEKTLSLEYFLYRFLQIKGQILH